MIHQKICEKWTIPETCNCPNCGQTVLSPSDKWRLRPFCSGVCPNCKHKLWKHPLGEIISVVPLPISLYAWYLWPGAQLLMAFSQSGRSFWIAETINFVVSCLILLLGWTAYYYLQCQIPLIPATWKSIWDLRPFLRMAK